MQYTGLHSNARQADPVAPQCGRPALFFPPAGDMLTIDLTDEELAALLAAAREKLDRDRFALGDIWSRSFLGA